MASAVFTANKKIEEAVTIIKKEIYNLGLSIELVDSVFHNLDNQKVYLFVYEKFYFRSSNRASLTVLITGDEFKTTIDVISSGGGQGFLFKLSLGAEKNFVNGLRKILVSKGFKETGQN